MSRTEEERVSGVSKCELAHAVIAINNLGLSHVDCKANALEYYTAHCSHLTRSAEFINVLISGLLISADVVKPEVTTVHTYFILMTATNIYTAEFTLSKRQGFCTGNHNLLKQQHSH